MIKYCLLLSFISLYGIIPVHTKSSPTIAEAATPTDPFLMPVEDVFSISGRGTVITGKIVRGQVKVGDSVDIVGINDHNIKVLVKGIEMFRKIQTEAKEGDNCGLLISSVMKEDVKRGMVMAKPGSIAAYKKFSCELIFKTKEEGGMSLPIADNFRPQFKIHNILFSGIIKLPTGMPNIKPAAKTIVTVELETAVAIEKDFKFSIVYGGKEIGSGIILDL